jgi:hypothetical protein
VFRLRTVASGEKGFPTRNLSFARRALFRWMHGFEPRTVGIAIVDSLHDWGRAGDY